MEKKKIVLLIISFVASLLLGIGNILLSRKSIFNFCLFDLFSLAIYTGVFYFINLKLFTIFEKKNIVNNYKSEFSVKRFLIQWLIIFLLWIPVFLAYYPTIWAYDVAVQTPSIIGNELNTFHPLIHTLFIDNIFSFGTKIGGYELGFVLLSIIQMIILSFCFAFSIEKITTYMRNKKFNKVLRIALIVFYGIMPFNSILSISMTKDVLFAGFFLVTFTLMYSIIKEDNIKKLKKSEIVLYIVFCTLTLLFRNNAIYAYLLFIFVIIILYFIQKQNKKILLIFIIPIATYFITQNGMIYLTGAVRSKGKQEMYSVPMQCLIGTTIKHQELLPKYGKNKKLFGLVPRDAFSKNIKYDYNDYIADGIKSKWAQSTAIDDIKLIFTWIKYGFKYPGDYIDSWGKLVIGAWYPFDTTHANIYQNMDRQGYLLTDYKETLNFPKPESKLKRLENQLEEVATKNVHQKYPIISLIFAPATYIWIIVFFMIFSIYNKLKKETIPLIFILTLYFTILLSPTIVIRYMYPIIVVAPIVITKFISRKVKGK